MIQEYARVSVEMPENEDKKSLSQELIFFHIIQFFLPTTCELRQVSV